MSVSERVGEQVGRAVGNIFAAVSRARGARTFHPRGDLARITVEPAGSEQHAFKRLGWSLRGPGLVRFSNALFKTPTGPDVLGCAIAFCDAAGKPEQHLLLATIKRPWTMPFAPFSTDTRDYLANDYFAVSPFDAPGFEQPVYFSLQRDDQQGSASAASGRTERFAAQVATHRQVLLVGGLSPRGPWTPVAWLTLEEVVPEDPSMEFDPFLDGRGLVPRGFVHALRKGVYAASRSGREAAQRLVTRPAGLR